MTEKHKKALSLLEINMIDVLKNIKDLPDTIDEWLVEAFTKKGLSNSVKGITARSSLLNTFNKEKILFYEVLPEGFRELFDVSDEGSLIYKEDGIEGKITLKSIPKLLGTTSEKVKVKVSSYENTFKPIQKYCSMLLFFERNIHLAKEGTLPKGIYTKTGIISNSAKAMELRSDVLRNTKIEILNNCKPEDFNSFFKIIQAKESLDVFYKKGEEIKIRTRGKVFIKDIFGNVFPTDKLLHTVRNLTIVHNQKTSFPYSTVLSRLIFSKMSEEYYDNLLISLIEVCNIFDDIDSYTDRALYMKKSLREVIGVDIRRIFKGKEDMHNYLREVLCNTDNTPRVFGGYKVVNDLMIQYKRLIVRDYFCVGEV